MQLLEALTQQPEGRIFAIVDSDSDEEAAWVVEPVEAAVLTVSQTHDFFVVKGKNIRADGTVTDCYVDICLPERISERAFFLREGRIDVRYQYECDGEILCAVPVDCFGLYEIFYSKIAPEIGIEILEEGLLTSTRKTHIAEDLGYILRDEGRFAEAASNFQIAADAGPSSYFIYGELADCYTEIGQADKASRYRKIFEDAATL